MSDIFREVDEEVRREQLQKLWERYQNLVVAVIALILIGVWLIFRQAKPAEREECETALPQG